MNDLDENKDLNNGNDYEYEDNYSEYSEYSEYSDYDDDTYTDHDLHIKKRNSNIVVYCKSGRIFNPYFPDWPSIYEARYKIKNINSYDDMIVILKSLFNVINDESKYYNKRLLVLMATECMIKFKNQINIFEEKNQRFIDLMIEKLSDFDHLKKYNNNFKKLSYKNNLETRKRYITLVLRKTILIEDVIFNITNLID
jgi:hypothetical protein